MLKKITYRTLYSQKLINFGLFILLLIIGEIILYFIAYKIFLPTLFFLDIFLICFLGSFIFVFKNLFIDMIYLPMIFLFIVFLYCLNYNYFSIFGNFFSLDTLKNAGDAFGILKAYFDLISIPSIVFYSLLFIVFTFLILFFNIKYRNNHKQDISNIKKSFTKASFFLITSLSLYVIGLSSSTLYEINRGNNTINRVSLSTKYYTKNFGVLSYYIKEIENKVFKSGDTSINEVLDYFNNFEYVNDEFTGLLRGYNVFTIMIETGARVMVNQYTTPTLYKLLNCGIDFKNNYSKNWTLASEYNGILGNNPSNSLDFSINYKLPFSLPNMLDNYETVYYQDIGPESDTYNQMKIMDKFGFKKIYYHDHLMPGVPEWTYGNCCWDLDSDVFKTINNDIKGFAHPFYAHYSTMVMHGHYSNYPGREKLFNSLNSKYENKLKNLIKDKKWINPLINTEHENNFYNYTLMTMDFDAGLESFINNLINLNLLDDTLIVLYGDHDIYSAEGSIPLSWTIKNKDNADEIDIYDTVFCLYNPKLNNYYYSKYNTHNYDKFISPSSIVPTILDLLGIKFNPNYYQGKSAFDSSYNNEIMFSYGLSNYMNKNYMSTNTTDIDKIFQDNNTKNIFIDKCKYYFEQQKYIDQIYNKNLFGKL